MRGALSGPTTAWDTKMDTRGTQTDLVTDRNIVDCLMELKSSAEFQDLSYRFSRSCTGEMTLIITRESCAGLLGIPFDPVSATITAGGFCYLSALFTPVEITDLRSSGSGSNVCLRKFRHILWKLNGRAGFGFCPGFREDHFPMGFRFKTYNLEVLRQPFTRIQSKGCPVFLQLRRTSSRASAQPLGIQLCSACFKALTDLYAKLKTSGEDLSKVPAFADFLPANSHPVDTILVNSKIRKEEKEMLEKLLHSKAEEEMLATEKSEPGTNVKDDGELLEKPTINTLALQTQLVFDGGVSVLTSEEEGRHLKTYGPSLSVANECEVVAEANSREKTENGKSAHSMVTMKECSVLLNRFYPGVSSSSKEDTAAVTAPDDTSTSCPRPAAQLPESSPFQASSQQLEPLAPSTTAPSSSVNEWKSVSAKSDSSRPVLSARIKPFRASVPKEKESTNSNISEGTEVTTSHNTPHRQHMERQGKNDTSPESGPPVLTPEMDLSPENSPQPLLIDEDADPDELGSVSVDEPGQVSFRRYLPTPVPLPKRACHRCDSCQEGYQSEADLQLHFLHCHQHDPFISSTATITSGSIPATVIDEVTSGLGDQRQQLTEQQKAQLLSADQQRLSTEQQLLPAQQLSEKEGPRWKVCPVCHSEYASKEEFETHMIERHRTRLHRCRYCGEKFALKKNLADHLQRHQGVKKLVCKECGVKFAKKKDFANHVRQHMGNLPYFCTICSKFFSRESVYEEHVERHRAKKGVRAVLTGDQKTLHGVLTKARRCLEEKVVLTSASTVAQATPSTVAQGVVTNTPPLPSSASAPNSEPPPSNLYLLSAVSLAQAELDRQPSDLGQEQPNSERASADLSQSNGTAAVKLLQLSSGEQNKTISDDTHTHAVVLDKKHHIVEDVQQPSVTESSSWPHNKNASSSLLSDCSSSYKKESGNGEQEQILLDKENKLRQKEQELEREQHILRKKMMMCQQLVLAQLSTQQRLKALNGVAGSGSQLDSGADAKPSPRQILMMFAALRKSVMGTGTTPSNRAAIRPPVSGPNSHRNAASSSSLPQSVDEKLGVDFNIAVATTSASSVLPQTKASSAGIDLHHPPLPPTYTSAGVPFRQNSLLHAPPRAPPPAAFMSSQSSAVTTNYPTLLRPQQAQFQKGGSFLEELMKLQSVMPAKVKEFLPKSVTSKAATHTPTPSPMGPSLTSGSVSKPAAVLCRKLPESPPRAMTEKGKGRSSRSKTGDKTNDSAQKKPGGWSGGQFKEKMNQVVTKVPPQEMSRLLSLSSITLPTIRNSASSRLSSSASPTTPAVPSASSSLSHADPPSPWLRSKKTPEVHPPNGSPASQVPPDGASCSSAPEHSSSPQSQTQATHVVPPSGTSASQVPPSPQNSAPPHSFTPQIPSSTHHTQPGNSLLQTPNVPFSHSSASHISSPSPLPHCQPPHVAAPHSSACQIPHGPPSASPATHIPPPHNSAASQIQPSSFHPHPMASPQVLSSHHPPHIPLGSPQTSHIPAPVRDPPASGAPVTNHSEPCLHPSLPSTVHPSLGVPCRYDEVPQPAAEVQIVAEEVGPIDLTKASSSRKRQVSEEGTEPGSTNSNKSAVLRHVLLEPPAAHARKQILAGESPVLVDQLATQPQVDFAPPQGLNPQAAAALHARIQASLQAVPDSPTAQALLRRLLPQLSHQSKGGSSRFLAPPAVQGRPPGMPGLIRGNVPLTQQRVRSPTPDRGHLLRSSTASVTVPSPPECAAPPMHSGPVSSVPSPAVSVPPCSPGAMQPVHSPPGTVSAVARPGSTSALSSPGVTASPMQTPASPPLHQQTATRYLLSPLPESKSNPKRFLQNTGARPDEEKSQPAVNPLGGFAWHRPAVVDPFVSPPKETNSSTAPDKPADSSAEGEASKDGRKKQADSEDLRDDQYLWRQQFLQTLREKRKQQQEQQERQQQERHQQLQQQEQQFIEQWQQEQERLRLQLDQPQDPLHTSSSKSGDKRRAPRRRSRKKDASNAVESAEDINISSSSDLQGTITSQAGISPIKEGDTSTAVKKAAKSRTTGSRARGKGRGRPRKTPTPPQLFGIDEAAVSVPQVVIEEGGAEFDGFVNDLGVKVEPLEAGVSCDACRKVMYSESEIVEHECDGLRMVSG